MLDSSAVETFTGLKFPTDRVQHALFEGVEREGPLKGQFTLFVVGDVPFENIIKRVQESEREYFQIYFGAGGRFDYNKETVRSVSEYFEVNGNELLVDITVENPIIDQVLLEDIDTLNWMCPILWHGMAVPPAIHSLQSVRPALREQVIVKLDTGVSTYAIRFDEFKVSDYSDYGDDVLLEQMEIQ